MVPPLLLLLLLLFLFFLFFLSLLSSAAVADCPSFGTCGGVNITYPFWRYDGSIPPPPPSHSPSPSPSPSSVYCGYPGFMIICEDDKPTLPLSSGHYYDVNHIDYDRLTVNLTDADVVAVPDESGCPRVRHNLTFSIDVSSSLTYADADANLTFFFNCSLDGESPPPVDPKQFEISCLNYEKKSSYVFFTNDADYEYWTSRCEEVVVAPVMAPDFPPGGNLVDPASWFGKALNDGFQLRWLPGAPQGCGECENSGGKCGFSQTSSSLNSTACFCPDGTLRETTCPGGGSKNRVGMIVGISVAAPVVVGLFLLCVFLCIRNRRRRHLHSSKNLISNASSDPNYYSKSQDVELGGGDSTLYQTHLFSYDELEEATDGFSDSRELGDGGFGTVYKGKLRDGRVVAIKRLYENNWRRVEQFKNEVEILSLIRHPNLVTLYGCTSRHSRELLLVYEFVSNGTIADHLHGSRTDERALVWPLRLSVAIETADALAYLHAVNPPIIHRDVKTNNILLDANFHVKVADFGLSRLFPLHATHVSTAPQGTPGYVDPEYHKCFQLTDKSDVYSFGVVLVELISSMPAVDITRRRDEINLASMAIRKIQNCQLDELVDPALGCEEDWATKRMITMVAELAFRCLQPDGEMRPPIREVVEVLRGIQKEGYNTNSKLEEGDITVKEDSGLLRNIAPFSPDSVTAKWASRSTTPNTSK